MLEQLVFNDLFFHTVTIIAAIVVIFVQTVNKVVTINKAWVKQVISWVFAIALTIGFYFGKFLYFSTVESGSSYSIFMIVFCGLFTGLVSNGIYDIPAIKAFLDKIFNMPKFDENGNYIEKKK